jgi:hypothetical protein
LHELAYYRAVWRGALFCKKILNAEKNLKKSEIPRKGKSKKSGIPLKQNLEKAEFR